MHIMASIHFLLLLSLIFRRDRRARGREFEMLICRTLANPGKASQASFQPQDCHGLKITTAMKVETIMKHLAQVIVKSLWHRNGQ